ncbi:MAG: hypothetical protein FD131_4797 [Rhodocyclaceae bacterium]|nr:MAG: hypothetical protein FD131_4797 [Rhodocyclaceae bacterium]
MTSKHDEHGDRCSCRVLAEATGCEPDTIRFSYCQAVLMKRWAMECNHGCRHGSAGSGSGDKWHDVGPIDPVKAILISNE